MILPFCPRLIMQSRSFIMQVVPRMQVALRLVTYLLLSFLILNSAFNNAFAHEIRPAIIDINLYQQAQSSTFKIAIKLNLEALISHIGAEGDSNESENEALYNSLREMPAEDLALEFLQFENFFVKNIQLSFDKKVYPLTVNNADIPPIGDLDLARDSTLYLEGNIPAGSNALRWKWDPSFGNAALRVNTADNPELHSSYLLEGQTSESIHFNTKSPNTSKSASQSTSQNSKKQGGWVLQWKTFKNYVQVGFVHIVPKGIDHILFVVGLFLLSASFRPLLIQITSFTLAHSVTLALGIYGIVNISSSIIEPLIAASIIYIAIENIYSNQLSRWRPIIIFMFGLLHGLGFASVLTEIGLSSNYYATGLIAFNVGVELGQLSIIAACFLFVGLWFRNKPWYRNYITIPASVLIGLIACYWLIERLGWLS